MASQLEPAAGELSGADVAVIIPAYERRDLLARCLESVAALDGLFGEVVVVDDGSPAPLADLVERYGPPFRYLHQENRGVVAARMRGVAESRARYLRFLDSDDYFLDRAALHRQVALLESLPRVGLVYGQAVQVDRLGRPFGHRRPRFARGTYVRSGEAELGDLLFGNYIPTSSVLVRREAFEAVGGFRDVYRSAASDWDCWLRLARDWWFGYLAEPVVAYRVHDQTITAAQSAERFLARHAEILDALFAESWWRERFGARRRAIEVYRFIGATRLAYRAGDLATARAYARRTIGLSLREADRRYLGEAVSLIARSLIPRDWQPALRRLSRSARIRLHASCRRGPATRPTE